MKVKVIMKQINEVKSVSVESSISEALDMLNSNRLLSMPVVADGKFSGVVSKHHVFESFFNGNLSKEAFLAEKVSEVLELADDISMPAVSENTTIEEAAILFIESKFRFIPVLGKGRRLMGIITQQAIFKEYQRLYGSGYDKLVIYSFDFKGTLAKIAETIAKMDGNIKNIIVSDTETMGLQEFFIRIESRDFDGIVKSLEKKGFDVRLPDR